MSALRESIYPLVYTCATKKDLLSGRQLLTQMLLNGLDTVSALADQLIRLFATCGTLFEANLLFCRTENPSVFTWHAIITAHVIHGEHTMAVFLFRHMQLDDIIPDKYVYTCVLRACANIGALKEGMLLHDLLARHTLDGELVVLNSLVDLYAKCKCLDEAYMIFCRSPDLDVVSWSTMIAGYAQFGHASYALELFEAMRGKGIYPDRVSYLSILKACCGVGAISVGKVFHSQVIRDGLQLDITIANTLIDMYVKCGSLEEAQKVFEHLPQRDVVSWASMIAAYSEHGRGFSAVDCFDKMREEGVELDRVTFLFLLKACGSIGALRKGRVVHEHIIRGGLESNVAVGSTVVDMYAKCGSFNEAHIALNRLRGRNTVSWNALIGGYADRGNYGMAVQCLESMLLEGLHPIASTFTSILTACSHGGFVKDGYQHFKSMKNEFGITPITDHLFCLVDLLSRSGRLDDATEVLSSIPAAKKDSSGWMSLLTASKKYNNAAVGRECFNQIKVLDPNDGACYILMSSIYANLQMWDQFAEIQEMRKREHAWKKPAQAWIEVGDKVHEFFVSETAHLVVDGTGFKQERLRKLLKQEGYVANLQGMVEFSQ
ncbi:hypothetical protein L7F22_007339 [Adiantum nelumboides]|nr:hypothetical protein [Adiantum nelumboides]